MIYNYYVLMEQRKGFLGFGNSTIAKGVTLDYRLDSPENLLRLLEQLEDEEGGKIMITNWIELK